MTTHWSSYNCTDCGTEMDYPGTCTSCLVKNQPVPEKLKEDLKKGSE